MADMQVGGEILIGEDQSLHLERLDAPILKYGRGHSRVRNVQAGEKTLKQELRSLSPIKLATCALIWRQA
jgi:hypothetical protein